MKWIAETSQPYRRYVIEKEEYTIERSREQVIEYKLIVYDQNGFDFYDGLQDTLDFAKQEALEEFGLPLTAWRQIP